MTVKRIRDPVHGLIKFEIDHEINPVDAVAWDLINTSEFQRLRRVKQLGVSEFTYPGATHTRFAHSIGVFHVARQLMKVVQRDIPLAKRDERRERVSCLAALLHDIGHGPFSHAFENAEKARLPKHEYKDHEDWTAELICRKDGKIRQIIDEGFGKEQCVPDQIAEMLRGEKQDLYSSVVSSSFDADRLDYLRRDRLMTGSGAGAIDFEWLLDNLRVVEVPVLLGEDPEEDAGVTIQVFAFDEKAIQAAESFILARFHLYSQVYTHKATRGIEQMLTQFLRIFSEEARKGRSGCLSVPENHPLRAYYAADPPNLNHYLALDDAVVWSAIELSEKEGEGMIRDFAQRICSRKVLKCVSIDMVNPEKADIARKNFVEEKIKYQTNKSVFVDRPKLSIYQDPNKESVKPHKKVYIQRDGHKVVDIASLSKPVKALLDEQDILRYYFINQDEREQVLKITGETDVAA